MQPVPSINDFFQSACASFIRIPKDPLQAHTVQLDHPFEICNVSEYLRHLFVFLRVWLCFWLAIGSAEVIELLLAADWMG